MSAFGPLRLKPEASRCPLKRAVDCWRAGGAWERWLALPPGEEAELALRRATSRRAPLRIGGVAARAGAARRPPPRRAPRRRAAHQHGEVRTADMFSEGEK